MEPFFLGGRWSNNQRKSNSVWYNMPHWKIIAPICCARRSPKVTLITVICQHCGMKTSTVTPSFYCVFNISLSCSINIPSFIENLWWDLLLGNHLKNVKEHTCLHQETFLFLCEAVTCFTKFKWKSKLGCTHWGSFAICLFPTYRYFNHLWN